MGERLLFKNVNVKAQVQFVLELQQDCFKRYEKTPLFHHIENVTHSFAAIWEHNSLVNITLTFALEAILISMFISVKC